MYTSIPLYLACHKRNASIWDHLSRPCSVSSAIVILRWKERIEIMKTFCLNFACISKRYNVKLKAKQYQANLPSKVWMNSSWQMILIKVPRVTSHPVVILCSNRLMTIDDRLAIETFYFQICLRGQLTNLSSSSWNAAVSLHSFLLVISLNVNSY